MSLEPGDIVAVTGVPPGFVDGLPIEDQQALTSIVGKPVLFVGYDDAGRAELEFKDRNHVTHFIYVEPSTVRLIRPGAQTH